MRVDAAPVVGKAVVGVDHGDTTIHQSAVDCTLLLGHALKVTQTGQMGPQCVTDQRHGRRSQAGEIGDFARVVHTHLDNRNTVLGAQTQQRQRQADVIVEVAGRRQYGSGRVAALAFDTRSRNGSAHFLDRRFAVAAGHTDQRKIELPTPPRGQGAKPQSGVVNHQPGQVIARRMRVGIGTIDHRGGRAGESGGIKKIVTVKTLAPQRHKQAASGERTCVGQHRVKLRGAGGLCADRASRCLQIHHRCAPWSLTHCARAARPCSTSENGWRTP